MRSSVSLYGYGGHLAEKAENDQRFRQDQDPNSGV